MPREGDVEASARTSLSRVRLLCLQDGPPLPLDQQLRRSSELEVLHVVPLLHHALLSDVGLSLRPLFLQLGHVALL